MHTVDILIPTCDRPAALAVTLTGLIAQTFDDFRVVVSDQSEGEDVRESGEVRAVVRVLEAHGNPVEIHRHLPRLGMAEQRHFLLEQARAPYALFLDDDLILEPYVLGKMVETLRDEGCGFVGAAPVGLSYLDDVRPHERRLEFWEGPVHPERVEPGTPAWDRYQLHNAANLYHAQQRLGLTPETQRRYRVAWVGACVLYDVEKLRAVGGYGFWTELPANHAGEDVVVQARLLRCWGGCGLIPSGVYHMELPTTVVDRSVDAPLTIDLEPPVTCPARKL